MSPKNIRTLSLAFAQLFNVKSWLSNPNDAVKLYGLQIISREVLSEGKKIGYLNEVGFSHFETIVSIINDAAKFKGQAAHFDIWDSCKVILGKLILLNSIPPEISIFLNLVYEHIESKIYSRTFVVSIEGVKLKEVETLPLGRFRLVRASAEFLFSNGISDEDSRIPDLIKKMGGAQVWFVGAVEATYEVAKTEFFHQARLAAGLLAVSAASTFDGGAHAFRISAVTPEETITHATAYLSWRTGEDFLGSGMHFRKGQDYKIDSVLAKEFQGTTPSATILKILQQSTHNKLEAAIVRAVYWFSDAHKDPVQVMRLVKFWSCIESFFSQKGDITKSVSIGTAAVLTFGPSNFVARADYFSIRKCLARLYEKRSEAVHNGMHDHVNSSDLADLSQWAAWLILNMAAMSDKYIDAEKVLEHCFDLDQKMTA